MSQIIPSPSVQGAETLASLVVTGNSAFSTVQVSGLLSGQIGTFTGQVTAPTVKSTGVALSSLPAASAAGAGARGFITDALTTVILGLGTTAAAGGANKVPVYSDGTNWIYG